MNIFLVSLFLVSLPLLLFGSLGGGYTVLFIVGAIIALLSTLMMVLTAGM